MKRVRVYKEIISDENLRLAIQEVNAAIGETAITS